MKRFIGAACAACVVLAGSPVAAQQTSRPSLWDFFSAENLATVMGHTLISWARLLADIRYEQLSVDPVAGQITLTGLTVSPFIPGFPSNACQVRATRATINGGPIDQITQGQSRIALDDMTMTAGCLPLDAANTLRGLGFRNLHANRAEIFIKYDYPSGGVDFRIHADLEKFASVSLAGEFAYVSVRMNFETEEPVVASDLTAAELTVQDRGGWDIAQKFLPPELKSPESAGQAVALGLEQALTEGNGLGKPPSARQGDFAVQAARVAERFVAGERTFTVSTNIGERPLRLDAGLVENPRALFDALNPSIATTAPAITSAIPVAALQAAMNAETPPENALELGRALATGLGAPRNENRALHLLAPLARNGDRDASFLIARLIGETRPAEAYPHALLAAVASLPGSLALADRIERRLTFQQAVDTQNTMTGSPDESLYDDVGAMRTAAREYLIGVNRPRSWRAAYYWASMAAAAGDRGGAALRDEFDDMLRLRGDGDAWRTEAAKLENGVLRDWIAKDVPSRLK